MRGGQIIPEKISWKLNVRVVEGRKMWASQTLSVVAYDKIQVTVGAGTSDKEVQIQPGGSGKVKLLLSSGNELS